MFQNGRVGRGLWLPTQLSIMMVWCGVLHDVALDAEHQLVLGVEEARPQPAAVLVEQLLGDGREERRGVEERPLLLDDAMDGAVPDLDFCRHGCLRSL